MAQHDPRGHLPGYFLTGFRHAHLNVPVTISGTQRMLGSLVQVRRVVVPPSNDQALLCIGAL
jgi:hypothetical protein